MISFVYDVRNKRFVREFNSVNMAKRFVNKVNQSYGSPVYNYLDGSELKYKEYMGKTKVDCPNTPIPQRINNYLNIVNDMKSFSWDLFYESAPVLLHNMHGKKMMHYRGYAAQTLITHICNDNTFLIEQEKDVQQFKWNKHNITVSLKSLFSKSLYNKHMSLKNLKFKMSDSFGTNTRSKPDFNDLPEICLITTSDGVVAIDRNVMYERAVHGGDGFYLQLQPFDMDVVYHNRNNFGCDGSNLDIKRDIHSVIDLNAYRAIAGVSA